MYYEGLSVDVQAGFYDDGRLGEVFFNTRKIGSKIDTILRDVALLVSVALQYGATIDELSKSAIRAPDGSADGVVSVLHDRLKSLFGEACVREPA